MRCRLQHIYVYRRQHRVHSWRFPLCPLRHSKQEACKLLLMTKDCMCTSNGTCAMYREGSRCMHESCLKCSMCSVKHFWNASREKCSVNPGAESEPSTVWPGACEPAFHLCSDKIIPTAWQPSSNSNNFKVLFEVRGSHTYNPALTTLISPYVLSLLLFIYYFHIYLH